MALTKKQIANYKFPKSKQMQGLLKFVSNTQGCFSKESFYAAGANSSTERYWLKAGLMEIKQNAKETTFALTPKFAREYKKQIDVQKPCSRSGINSYRHSEALAKTVLAIPKDVASDRILNDSEAKNGDYQKPPQYEIDKRVNEIADAITNRYLETKIAYESASGEEKVNLYYQLQEAQKMYEHVSEDRVYRSPDLVVTFTPAQLQEFHDNMKAIYDEKHFCAGRNKELAYEGLHKIERLIAQSVVTHTTEITVSMEVITNNYGADEIQLHENFSAIMGIEQIFIPAN